MSSAEPAPSTMVVLSLSMVTRLAWPSMPSVTFSSLMPRSSEIISPLVRIAMSSSIALRRSPKPGSLDGRDLQAAAQLVDDERGERFAFDVFGDDQQRTARLHHGFEDRQHRLQVRQLLLVDQDVGVFEFDRHLFGLVMK
jgi:hypothetical protein